MDFYYTYVLKSQEEGKLYIGFTKDIKGRVIMHKKGEVNATRERLPVELVYYEACRDKRSAVRREKQLKTGFGRAYLKRRLEL